MEETTRDILKRHGFLTKKSMGQNFLFDQRILEKIAQDSGAGAEDTVVEIGPGAGTLTRVVAGRVKRVVSVELDKELIPILAETLAGVDNVTVVNHDFTKLDLNKFYNEVVQAPFCVVANLPYNVATVIIMSLLESGLPVKSITVLVQREVAERMAAKPGTSEYGALSCAVQYRAVPQLLTKIPPGAFFPPPNVVSQVVRLEVLDKPSVEVADEKMLFKVIKAAFAMRRKTLANNLISAFSLDRDTAVAIINEAGLPENVRGERLNLSEMAKLSEIIKEKMQK